MNSVLYDLETGTVISTFNHEIPEAMVTAGRGVLLTEEYLQPDEWRVSAGELVPVATPTVDPMIAIRAQRDALLLNCDWTQLPDAALTEAQVQAFRNYRQALRDLPEEDPIVWPERPTLGEETP